MNPSSVTAAPRIVNRFFEFSLLGMLAAGYFAVLGSGFLDWPTAALTLLGLCARTLMVSGVVVIEPPPRVVAALAIAYIGFFPVDYYYVSGTFLSATVHMVFFLAVLKLLTAKTPRDFGYLKAIAGLELIAAAVLSEGLSFLVYLAVFVLFAIATFASGEVRRAAGAQAVVSRGGLKAFSRRLGVVSACLFGGILFMTICLFFVLPRTARAAFERFAPARYHLAGFSNNVTLGEIGRIKQSSTPVMHVRSFQGEGFLPVKWRGAALAEFDGKRWFNPPGQEQAIQVEDGQVVVRSATEGAARGPNLIYQVHLEPLIADTLFFAGTVETIKIDVRYLRYSRGGGFHVSPRYGNRGLNYSAYGFLPNEWAPGRYTAQLPQGILREYLELPPTDARIGELARQMTAGAQTQAQKARALEGHLRQDYGYTLELLSKPVEDPLAYFLFVRKKGHCEYFASSMAVMLRTLGIPSRVVTGFQSGVYNPMTGWQVIRASDAHSWVEAWITGRGWTTFDPTPFDPSGGEPGLMSRLALLSDTASQYWSDWVMSYDLEHQVALASRMHAAAQRVRFPDFDELVAGLKDAGRAGFRHLPLAGGAIAIAVLWLLFGSAIAKWWKQRAHARKVERGAGEPSDATILYQQMLELLAKRGIQKPPWFTPIEFARVVRAPQMAPLVEEATAAYNELRYGGRRDAAPRMMRVLEQIRQL
jgi:transglutaminase-like putative cysteine protease